MSLRTRIITIYVLLMAASFSCLIYLIAEDVRPRYLEAVEDSMVDIAELTAASLAQEISHGKLDLTAINAAMSDLRNRTFSAKIYNIHKNAVDLHIYITDAKGILLYDSTGENKPGADFSQWRDVFLTLQGRYGARSTQVDKNSDARVLYVAAPIIKNGEIFGVVSVGKPNDNISFLIAIAKERFIFSLLIVGLAAMGLGIALSVWITRPLKRLLDYMHSVRREEARPLPPLGPSEIEALGAALAEMQNKLEGKNYIEDYVRALTHEMKSPLTAIKGAGEILREHVSDERAMKFLNNIDSETERLHSLVERTLQLSRLENIHAVSKTRIAAEAFFNCLTESFQHQLDKKSLHLEKHIPPGLSLEGDELLLRQAFSNLIANAIDFAPPDSQISLSAFEEGGKLRVVIEDQGAGIPDFAFNKVFDKFFSLPRPDSGKKSSGLGLPFVKEVLSLHGGKISLENTRPGLKAEVVLPLKDSRETN